MSGGIRNNLRAYQLTFAIAAGALFGVVQQQKYQLLATQSAGFGLLTSGRLYLCPTIFY
jgi:hypothetical protein